MKNWFPHDYTASRDVKILSLLRAGGGLYYGLYWATVEAMHTEQSMTKDELEMYLAFVMRAQDNEIEGFIQAALKAKLIQISEDRIITIDRVTRNLEQRTEISERRRQSVAKRWAAKKTDANNSNTVAIQNNTNVSPNSTSVIEADTSALLDTAHFIQNDTHNNTDITDKTRQDKTSQRESGEGAPQGVNDVVAYFLTQNSTEVEARKMYAYYNAIGWNLAGKGPVKNWHSLADLWILRPNQRGGAGEKAKRGDRGQETGIQSYVQSMAEAAKSPIRASAIEPQYVVLQPTEPPGVLPQPPNLAGASKGDAG